MKKLESFFGVAAITLLAPLSVWACGNNDGCSLQVQIVNKSRNLTYYVSGPLQGTKNASVDGAAMNTMLVPLAQLSANFTAYYSNSPGINLVFNVATVPVGTPTSLTITTPNYDNRNSYTANNPFSCNPIYPPPSNFNIGVQCQILDAPTLQIMPPSLLNLTSR